MRWLLIEDPNLECNSCFERKKDFRTLPLCQTEKGCPIQPLAQSMKIRDLILAYTQYKRMNMGNMPEFLQMKLLNDSGLMQVGYDLLIAFESVYNDYIQSEREEGARKAELDRIRQEEKNKYRGR